MKQTSTFQTLYLTSCLSGMLFFVYSNELQSAEQMKPGGKPDSTIQLSVKPETERYTVLGMGGNYVFGGVTGPIAKHTLATIPLTYSRTQMVLQNLNDFSGATNLDAAARAAIAERDQPGTALGKALVIERELARRKIPSLISVWRVPDWMLDTTTRRNASLIAEEKWPALIAAVRQYLIYIRETCGSEPVAFSFNEPDTGVHVKFSAEQHRDAIKKIGAGLAAKKLKTKMVLGDLNHAAHSIKYLRPAVADPEAMKHVGIISFHSWGGADPDEYAEWPALARRLNLPLMVGEAGPNSRALKDGTLKTSRLALAEMDQYQEMLLYACPQAIIHWEYTADFRLLDEDPAVPGRLEPNFRYALQKHWVTFIPAGSMALETIGSTGNVYFTAFAFPQDSKRGYSLFITNSGNEPKQVMVTGMPDEVHDLNVVCSSMQKFFTIGKPLKKTRSGFSVDVPAQSIMTLTTADAGAILEPR